jgi:hypothetical protein
MGGEKDGGIGAISVNTPVLCKIPSALRGLLLAVVVIVKPPQRGLTSYRFHSRWFGRTLSANWNQTSETLMWSLPVVMTFNPLEYVVEILFT